MSEIKSGSEKVFRKIYEEYYSRLYSFIFGYLKDEDQSKEVVQNAFFKLWMKRSELRDDTNINAWLFTVVKNECLNVLKKRENLLKFRDDTKYAENERLRRQITALNSFVPEKITVSEISDIIGEAVNEMSERCRKIYIMSRNMGLTHGEIAKELDISEKTVENHISKALKIIKRKLSDNYFRLH